MPTGCILISDFGAACERRRQPQLCGQPLALTGGDGLLQVVSEEALPYGIRAGQLASGARSLCPAIVLRPYDREFYADAARGVWNLLAIESSVVEPVSPEVCFIEMSGPDAALRLRTLARKIARLVKAPTQAGLASSKLVARQAALRAEPSHTGAEPVTVEAGREADFLTDLSLSRLPDLDSALLKRLERLGIRTLGDVLRVKPHELHRLCRRSGVLLRRLAMGQDGDRVRAAWPPRAIDATLRFETEVSEEAALCEALRICAERLSRLLAPGGDYCRALRLEVSLEDGTEARTEEKLKEPVSSADALLRVAIRLLQRLRLRQAALAVRVTAGGLGSGSGVQLVLLDEFGNGFLRERMERLEAALAALRKRYGEQAVVRASLLRPERRIDLWTCALTRSANESVEVTVDTHGAPVLFWRRGRRYDVETVQDRWKEADWFGGAEETTAYRISIGSGLYELHCTGEAWHIRGIAD